MIPIRGLFETHVTVADLDRSMEFYGGKLGLELAAEFRDRNASFYWIGGRGRSMLGLWAAGPGPQRLSLHLAFAVNLHDILDATGKLRAAGIEALDFSGCPTEQPVVLAWMPAASLYFRDPDGNLLEFLAMLPDTPQPELGIIPWDEWNRRTTKGPTLRR
jgi:lactoylglutathione lyase